MQWSLSTAATPWSRFYTTSIPPSTPILQPAFLRNFGYSLLFLHTSYYGLSFFYFRGPDKIKQRCWILTTIASAVMSLGSMPYLWDFFTGGCTFAALHLRTKSLSEPLVAFFVAYLTSDLLLGYIFYRKLVNIASGWVHHTAYTFFFLYWGHRGWGHLAGLASIFELPTFVMGIASLYPPLRSNMGFTVTFFLTRVFFHAALLYGSALESSRNAPNINGSWGPTVFIAITYPMHLWWGYKCILSVRRRMAKRKIDKKAKMMEENRFAVAAGQFLNGLAPPDTSSAINTPATTPGAQPVQPNTVQAFARAAAASQPMQLILGRKNKNKKIAASVAGSETGASSDGESDSGSTRREGSSGSRRTMGARSHSSAFTTPVAPHGAGPDDREPFLPIRSPAESRDRARRLVADAVRKAWSSAPQAWRDQFEQEAKAAAEQVRREAAAGKVGTKSEANSDTDTAGDGEVQPARLDRRTRARRALLRAVRRAVNGPPSQPDADADNAPHGEGSSGANGRPETPTRAKRLPNFDFDTLIKLLPPDFYGQDYELAPFPVERDANTGRRERFVGQLKRRIAVARREVVVFD